jgi:hypothetical protein
MTHSPAGAAWRAVEVSTAAAPCEREVTAAALSQFGELGAALSQYAAAATVMAVTGIGVVSAPPQWARLRSGLLLRGPTTVAAAATTPTATGFAQTGIILPTERRDAVGLWCARSGWRTRTTARRKRCIRCIRPLPVEADYMRKTIPGLTVAFAVMLLLVAPAATEEKMVVETSKLT